MARVARALAHPARVRILRILAAQDTCTGAEIFGELPLAQSTISQHLTVLKEAGLVRATPHGTSMRYCIVGESLAEFGDALSMLGAESPACGGEGE